MFTSLLGLLALASNQIDSKQHKQDQDREAEEFYVRCNKHSSSDQLLMLLIGLRDEPQDVANFTDSSIGESTRRNVFVAGETYTYSLHMISLVFAQRP